MDSDGNLWFKWIFKVMASSVFDVLVDKETDPGWAITVPQPV